MGAPEKPAPAVLLVGTLFADQAALDEAERRLEAVYGPIAMKSPTRDFVWSDYYKPEMGLGIKRRHLIFESLICPGDIAAIKLASNRLEEELAGADGKRRVNLDPGYLTLAKLVLATTKDAAQRIYLRDGILAEITISWRKGAWRPHEWTYPDYRDEAHLAWFAEVRKQFEGKLKEK